MTTTFGPYPARCQQVYDGDTIVLDIDLGFDHIISGLDFDGKRRLACRVFGINAPELSTQEGKEAKAFAEGLLPLGTRCQVVSHGYDKYGSRWDGTITLPDGRDFATVMLETNHAVPYTP